MDALELDEFNLSDEDFAALAASMVDDRKQTEPLPSSAVSMIRQPLSVPTSVSQQQSSSPSQTVQPPKPSPRTRKLQQPSQLSPAKPSSGSSRPAGLIDLDAPEFAEFDMTDEELEALAASFVDDRGTSSEGAAKLEPPPPAPQQTTKSLPAKVLRCLYAIGNWSDRPLPLFTGRWAVCVSDRHTLFTGRQAVCVSIGVPCSLVDGLCVYR